MPDICAPTSRKWLPHFSRHMQQSSRTNNFPTEVYEHPHRLWLLWEQLISALAFSIFKNEKHQPQVPTCSHHKQISEQETDWVVTKGDLKLLSTRHKYTNSYEQRKRSRQALKKERDLSRKHPALSTRCNHFKKGLRDKKYEITAELGSTDDAQPLPGDVEVAECMFCAGRWVNVLRRSLSASSAQLSFRKTMTARTGSAATLVWSGVTPFASISMMNFSFVICASIRTNLN
jgi:hypothetical protein